MSNLTVSLRSPKPFIVPIRVNIVTISGSLTHNSSNSADALLFRNLSASLPNYWNLATAR